MVLNAGVFTECTLHLRTCVNLLPSHCTYLAEGSHNLTFTLVYFWNCS